MILITFLYGITSGLAVPVVGVNALETAKDYTDKMVIVK
jgi:hypothetical protein